MNLNHNSFRIVAGPCSAETEDQVFETAKALRAIGITQFRAGIWKPRTRANAFEGVGEIGFAWLQRVQKELGMQVIVETGTAHHVELALKYDMDMIWIGARTTTNPFSVQEIADALQGVDIPVLIKNSVCPDLELWIGAIERIRLAGIKDITAIHRGFLLESSKPYRNSPLWELPLKLKMAFPELKVLCDPSHITGKRNLIEEVCKKAIELQMDGLFIESHCCPDLALTDPLQQLTPNALANLLQTL